MEVYVDREATFVAPTGYEDKPYMILSTQSGLVVIWIETNTSVNARTTAVTERPPSHHHDCVLDGHVFDGEGVCAVCLQTKDA